MASTSRDISNAVTLTEDDIPGASLAGRNPSSLKNEEPKFWLRCRGDSLKGLLKNESTTRKAVRTCLRTQFYICFPRPHNVSCMKFRFFFLDYVAESKSTLKMAGTKWSLIMIQTKFIPTERK